MANHQINITENGTTALLTEGKYCDRNIDVVVNVPSSGGATPTQFTNILNLDTTIVKSGFRCTSSKYTETSDGVAIVCPLSAGTHRIRTRGKYVLGFLQVSKSGSTSTFGANVYKATATPTESTFTGTQLTTIGTSPIGQDEYGDFYQDITMPSDGYLGFTLKDMSLIYPNETFMNPIITIDEPIGNGGVV